MNKIAIKNLQKKKINLQNLKTLADKTLQGQGIDGKEVSVLLVNDKVIAGFNKKYLNNDYPTDVLAFRMQDGEFSEMHSEVLGDVLISIDTAAACAGEFNTSLEYECQLYLVHGILHLLGFADSNARGRKKMESMQKKILEDYA